MLVIWVGSALVNKIAGVALGLNQEVNPIELAEHNHTVEGNIYVNLSVVLFCTCFAGLMSGLTIGLASVDRLSLEVDSIGNPDVQRKCKRIFPVID